MATKFFMNGGVNSNWSADTNWSTTASSGPNNTTHAVNGDAVILNAGSPACIVDAASAATSIVCTGYTNTLTFNATLTLAGTCTFVSGMTIAGTSDLIVTASATLTSGGKTLTGGMQFKGSSQTYTLADNWSVTGAVVCSGTTLITINNNGTAKTLTVAGGVTTTTNTTGSAKLVMTGGTWTGAAGYLGMSLDLQGNVTVSGTCIYRTGTITYVSGTITMGTSILSVSGAAATINTPNITWANVTVAAILTINALLLISGTLTLGDANFSLAGTAGVTATTWASSITTNRTHTLTAGNTYTCTTAWNVTGTASAILTLTSSHATNKVTMTLGTGATQDMIYVNPVRIDSSNGQEMVSLRGTISTCFNWFNKVPVGSDLIQPSLALGV